MVRRFLTLPLFLILAGIGSVSMIAPAVFALRIEAFHDARSFFYSGLVGLILTTLVGIAMSTRPASDSPLKQLLTLLAAFAILPAFLAVPFYEAVRNTTFVNAYFEMVSSFTTTGATLFDADRLSGPEHLWRAQVGWMGGLLMWIAAAAILAPLTLGGFEVTAIGEPGQTPVSGEARGDISGPAQRLARSAHTLIPVYAGLTLSIWILLLVLGDTPLVALCHAMSVMATSGITPLADLGQSQSGIAGEMVLFCFLFFALSRSTFSTDTGANSWRGFWQDPEFRLGTLIVLLVTLLLFSRHFVAALDFGDDEGALQALRALWGGVFTSLSFLTTTGFVSADWGAAQNWSGLQTPGLILLGLAMVGGGVATTAGGVKLLRVFALYLNGLREIEKLVHPSSVGRTGVMGRRIRKEGAFIAWVFFMLFALTLAAVTMLLALLGVPFEPSFVLAIAALTNTGPLIGISAAEPVELLRLGTEAKALLGAAMVLGRLELLALIVMLTPDLWRN
ncbi:TrkH family potassium uptake protein [Aestuariicoccus sp. MJ-SS9]|uniref:TrkH family potassium uptake protein n=1 Tax=Aestuariicoccus sp. MJ-SS9 TaxID=3079855 RepID=UPI0029067BAA|nr:potassium transporter TrkG [Aestuariicoccus sp. MJ-SS9]MDU8911516.1 potassium transporter TrkG [Aestuariicoccus sp. MJ-SS9]